MIGTVLGCLVTGIPADTYCLSLSLLLAFAMSISLALLRISASLIIVSMIF